MIGADAVDPGIDFVGIDIEARIEFGTGRGDALGFPGRACRSASVSGRGALVGVGVQRVHGEQDNLPSDRRPGFRPVGLRWSPLRPLRSFMIRRRAAIAFS